MDFKIILQEGVWLDVAVLWMVSLYRHIIQDFLKIQMLGLITCAIMNTMAITVRECVIHIWIVRTGELRDAIEGLGPGEYVAGDAANSVTEHLLVPFTGSQHDDKKQDAFNFISKSVKDKNRNSIWVLGQKI